MDTSIGLVKNPSVSVAEQYDPSADVTLFCGDCLELLGQISAARSQAELIVTSPPYNLGKEYEQRRGLEAYVEDQRRTIEACLDVLSPSGSICWQVGHYIEGSGREKEAYPLDLVLYPVFKSYGLRLRNRIIWTFGHGLHEKHRFTGRHETILWFTRETADYTFNLDPVRVPQKYPGKRAFRGPNKGKPSGNPLGKNPSDIWDMPNVKANHIEKTGHPCQFPIGLVQRLILALTNEGDLVVDPYLGVGTTAAAALLSGRRAAGADTEPRYIEIARERTLAAAEGSLRFRPMNKPVYTPTGSERVSQRPSEWQYPAGDALQAKIERNAAQRRLLEPSAEESGPGSD